MISAIAEDSTLESYEDEEGIGVATAKNSMLYISSKVLSSLVIIIILIFLARILKPEYYGFYTIVIAFSTLLGAGGNFGVGTTFRKKLAEIGVSLKEKSNIISSGITISFLIGFILMVIGIVFSRYIAYSIYHEPLLYIPFIASSIIVLLTVIYGVTSAVLFGINKVKHASYINIAYSISQAAAVLILVLLGYGIIGALIGIAISLVIGSIISIYYIVKFVHYRFSFQPRSRLRGLFNFSTPILVSNLVYLGLTSFAITFLAIFVSPSIVGSYGVAFRFGRIIEVITASLSFVLLPAFSSVISNKERRESISRVFNGSIYYSFLFLAPLTAYLISVSKPLMYLLFSSSYHDSYIFFSFIVLGLFINIIGVLSGQLMVGYGKTKSFMKYQLLTLVIELSMLLVLTPIFKVYGVLLSLFVIGPVLFSFIYVIALRNEFKMNVKLSKLLLISISAVILFAIGYAITAFLHYSYISILANLVLALVIFIPIAVFLKGVDSENVQFIERIGKRYKKIKFATDAVARYARFFLGN
ncbi:flippase [Candidatus Mancarchaeum acidiphilum]|uniref:Flippase n=1 Tax=Candidatus Mancarchaeum acidiphilum TaxID=1920749 RepID=A0A218NMG8_9ARCH|nr:oligosaccharide flippase family protein [Candidatus Mancarchaeum acidiphilum]ASI13651.1 flippase [Candidatus Mancarchaeum acidiphilum]